MELLRGISYNLRGVMMCVGNSKLFLLGTVRFLIVLVAVGFSAWLIIGFHSEIMAQLWERPESLYLVFLWHLLSWILAAFLIGITVVVSYMISQLLFSVIIMDYMSRIVENKITGRVGEPTRLSFLRFFFYLIRQEIPRTIVPVIVSLLLFFMGWFVFLGPVISILSAIAVSAFLAWDNTDIVPARRLIPFRQRFRLFLNSLPFHIGFGLPFLIPILNIAFLCFAPVGGTLYYLEREQSELNNLSDKTINPEISA